MDQGLRLRNEDYFSAVAFHGQLHRLFKRFNAYAVRDHLVHVNEVCESNRASCPTWTTSFVR